MSGKVTVITGGNSGIGLGFARGIAKAGEDLVAEAVTAVEPGHRGGVRFQLAANEMILAQAGRENFSEVRWLESEIRRLRAELGEAAG